MEDITINAPGVSDISSVVIEEDEVVQYSTRFDAMYECVNGHTTIVPLSTNAEVPPDWPCNTCSDESAMLKNSDKKATNTPEKRPKMTPWEKLLSRRTEEELEQMLNERIAQLRSGEIARVFTV